MKRRLTVIVLTLAGVTATAALASATDTAPDREEELCLVLAHDPHGQSTDDFCLTFVVPGHLGR